MTEKPTLYDLRKNDYPSKRGDTFRCLQVAECYVCGGKSNRVNMGGWPGYGVRMLCPNGSECWHHEIEDKLKWLAKPHPQEYAEALLKEIIEMKTRCAAQVTNDIEGEPDFSLTRGMSNVRWYRDGKICPHHY